MNNHQLISIAIHGVPRSGTSWLGEIFNSSPHTIYKFQPLFSYKFKDFLTSSSNREDIQKFFNLLAQTQDDFIDRTEQRKNLILPTFSKEKITHIVYKEVRYHNILSNLMKKNDSLYLVAIIRNPFSVIQSWFNALREFRHDLEWNILEEWRYACKKNMNKEEEFYGYEKWKEAARIFLKLQNKYPNRVYILKYHQLLVDPLSKIQNLFDFCQIPLTKQTQTFLRDSSIYSNSDTYSVYRVKQTDDTWRETLHPKIIAEITNDLKNSELKDFCTTVNYS